MRSRYIFILLILFLVCVTGCASVSESGDEYRESLREIHEGKPYFDFAFLHFKAILDDNPNSAYAPQAAFAVGEYYFDVADYYNAIKTLYMYIHQYPKDRGVIFAKLILYKIISSVQKETIVGVEEDTLIKEIRKDLFSQPLFLIFYDKKLPRSYQSLFRNSYTVYDYVDKIKVLRNGKSFLELSP
jgi:outer membrane protein assembly factor BamD (BamD/ComL family)